MRLALLALVYFLILFAIGFALGVVRTLWVVPALGTRWAEVLEMPLMLIAIFFTARGIARRFSPQDTTARRLAVGFAALALMLLFDLAVGLFLRGMTLRQAFLEKDPVAGALYYAALLIFALLPWWLGRHAAKAPTST